MARPSISQLIVASLAWLIAGPATGDATPETLFQYSTVDALIAGGYDGDFSIKELALHGDHGIGTINGVDGELIAIDGHFYSVKADGKAYRLKDTDRTPFAVVSFFDADQKADLPSNLDLDGLKQHLDSMIRRPNDFQAIRIDGHFTSIQVRSEPKQTPPYSPLSVVMAEQQATFQLNDVAGSLVGFRMPAFMSRLNVPGYHFHFLTADRIRGGHLLALESKNGMIQIDTLYGFEMQLPKTVGFNELRLDGDRSEELRGVEQK